MLEICNFGAENSLTRSESGKERLRQEAEASRAEIWRKIQAAKLNNSQKQRVSSRLSCTAVPHCHALHKQGGYCCPAALPCYLALMLYTAFQHHKAETGSAMCFNMIQHSLTSF